MTLQAQQPLNNVVRVAMQALSAVLGGTQSLHTNGYDEALALPTAEAATLALRTQQIIAYESGAALDGRSARRAATTSSSSRTSSSAARLELLAKVDELGGAAKAIGASFFQEEIARSAYEYQMRVERGETVIVGVNKFADDSPPPVIPTPDYSALEREQVERVRARSCASATRRASTTRSRRCARPRAATASTASAGARRSWS